MLGRSQESCDSHERRFHYSGFDKAPYSPSKAEYTGVFAVGKKSSLSANNLRQIPSQDTGDVGVGGLAVPFHRSTSFSLSRSAAAAHPCVLPAVCRILTTALRRAASGLGQFRLIHGADHGTRPLLSA